MTKDRFAEGRLYCISVGASSRLESDQAHLTAYGLGAFGPAPLRQFALRDQAPLFRVRFFGTRISTCRCRSLRSDSDAVNTQSSRHRGSGGHSGEPITKRGKYLLPHRPVLVGNNSQCDPTSQYVVLNREPIGERDAEEVSRRFRETVHVGVCKKGNGRRLELGPSLKDLQQCLPRPGRQNVDCSRKASVFQ